MKRTITPTERLQLIGLLALATTHDDTLADIERSTHVLLAVTEEDGNVVGDAGHISDAIWTKHLRDADQLLERLGIAVLGAAEVNAADAWLDAIIAFKGATDEGRAHAAFLKRLLGGGGARP